MIAAVSTPVRAALCCFRFFGDAAGRVSLRGGASAIGSTTSSSSNSSKASGAGAWTDAGRAARFEGTGMWTGSPHPLHFPLRPASAEGTSIFVRHFGHENRMVVGIAAAQAGRGGLGMRSRYSDRSSKSNTPPDSLTA